jgi:hypothetical protein
MSFRLRILRRHAEENSRHLVYRVNGCTQLGVERSFMSRYVFIHPEYVVYYRHISPQIHVPHTYVLMENMGTYPDADKSIIVK